MNISRIKNRADELLLTCQPQVIRIMTIMMLIGLIPSLFSGSGNIFISLISLILTIVFIAFGHGYVVTGLKVVRNRQDSLSDDDAFVGFTRFKELFSTYLITGVIMFAIVVAIILVLTLLFSLLFGSYLSWSASHSMTVYSNLSGGGDYSYLFNLLLVNPVMVLLIILFVVIVIIAVAIISVYLFAVPYLLEQYHMKNMVAVKESFAMMKNHIWDMIKLELSFLGWMLLTVIAQSVVTQLLSFIPILGSMIGAIVGGFVGIYTYIPKYHISQTILFEEISYYRYDQPQQSTMDNQGEHL